MKLEGENIKKPLEIKFEIGAGGLIP